jgi:hypothetical protein
VAWRLEPCAAGVLATVLSQAAAVAYFLQSRPRGGPAAPRLTVPVTATRATAWFVAHPGHVVAANALAA